MVKGDQAQALQFQMDSPILRKPRPAKHKDDFGDQESVGLCLKIPGMKAMSLGFDRFGTWLGRHGDKYVVGIVGPNRELTGCEIFDTLDEVHQRWILD